jgi:hypothetical protein
MPTSLDTLTDSFQTQNALFSRDFEADGFPQAASLWRNPTAPTVVALGK